jgi:diacylglycerol kinase
MVSSEHKDDPREATRAGSEKDVLITPDGEELDQSVVGTLKIDPGKLRRVTNPNRFTSLKFALSGLLYVLVREQSIQLASLLTIVVIAVGLWLQIPVINWAFLTLALGSIWITECLNTAIEAAINLGTSEPHPLAKIGKDVASAAALVSTIVFVIICFLILLPRIVDRLSRLA